MTPTTYHKTEQHHTTPPTITESINNRKSKPTHTIPLLQPRPPLHPPLITKPNSQLQSTNDQEPTRRFMNPQQHPLTHTRKHQSHNPMGPQQHTNPQSEPYQTLPLLTPSTDLTKTSHGTLTHDYNPAHEEPTTNNTPSSTQPHNHTNQHSQ